MDLLLRDLDDASEISQAEKGDPNVSTDGEDSEPWGTWVGSEGLDKGGFSLPWGSVGRLTPDVSLVGSILNFKRNLCGRCQFAYFHMLKTSNRQNIGISVSIHHDASVPSRKGHGTAMQWLPTPNLLLLSYTLGIGKCTRTIP